MNAKPSLVFEKPGPGSWSFDRTHQQVPACELFQPPIAEGMTRGMRRGFAAVGSLLDTIEARFVHGWLYNSPRPVGAPPDARGTPPKLLFKALLALHPELRRRVRTARQSWQERPWLAHATWFEAELAPRRTAQLRQLQAVDPAALDDAALRRHLAELLALFQEMFEDHFVLAAHATPAVGQLLVLGRRLPEVEASELIRIVAGASPVTRRPGELLAEIGRALRASGADALLDRPDPLPALLAALRSADPVAGARVDGWLAEYGWRAIGLDDINARPLLAQPELVRSLLRAAARGEPAAAREEDGLAVAAALRARLPVEVHEELDRAVAEARHATRPRELSCELVAWVQGLAWRAAHALGQREARAGRLERADLVFHCWPAELAEGAALPSTQVLREREALRHQASQGAPAVLGEPGTPPPTAWLPDGARQLTEAVFAFIERFEATPDLDPEAPPLTGLAVSPGVVEGRAFVLTPERGAGEVHPGDILVARATSPTLNAVLSTVSGLVTEYGGLICHAAIVSRELGFPGVVGCREATTAIPHGAWIRVDGDRGRVEVLALHSPEPTAEAPRPAAPAAIPRVPDRPGRWAPLAEALDPARYGGKSAHLAVAIRAGQPVPPGVALDVDLVEAIAAGDPASLARLAEATRGLATPLAARSSAPGEDGAGASFAGLHETRLGLRSFDELVEAIGEIRASAHGPAALRYRARLGITGRPAMAVLVQQLVPAEVAGVRFGRDPISGADERVIEAAPGLGVAVVDGRVRPDRFRLDPDGRELEREVGDKPVRLRADGEGLVEEAVAADEAGAVCLDPAQLAAIHRLGQACDGLYGRAQDIEWALVDGRLWLLQSRPVTTGEQA